MVNVTVNVPNVANVCVGLSAEELGLPSPKSQFTTEAGHSGPVEAWNCTSVPSQNSV